MKKVAWCLGALVILITACKKEEEAKPAQIENLAISDNFNYQTSEKVEVSATVNSFTGEPLSGIRVDFFDGKPEEGGEMFASAFTNASGQFNVSLKVPTFWEKIYAKCNTQGLINEVEVLVNPTVQLSFGGVPPAKPLGQLVIPSVFRTSAGANMYYIGGVDGFGLPDYVISAASDITKELLQDVNASLPETRDVSVENPSYLTVSDNLNLDLTEENEVFITFLGEGTTKQNSLGFFTYPTNNPPTSAAQIDSVFLAFPNASFTAGGGALKVGDQVSIGTFSAGTSIGWVLIQDGWNTFSKRVNTLKPKFYSFPAFNPEGEALGQHNVQLYDSIRKVVVLGFEDNARNGLERNSDFNDNIFLIKVKKPNAIRKSFLSKLKRRKDSDRDGVPDSQDEYPFDPKRVANIRYSGSLGFEDLWPVQGDYDFNDLVVTYNVAHVVDRENLVVDIKSNWTIKAVGAGFNNGFGFNLEFVEPSLVKAAVGAQITGNTTTLNANGTEAGLNSSCFIVWDETFAQIQGSGGPFINTIKTDPRTEPVTKSMNIEFVSPVGTEEIGLPPYNPFIFVDGDRRKEIHLSGYKPTGKADITMFGMADDSSDAAKGRYYKSGKNLPWAIHIYGNYDYPQEYAAINTAYLKFNGWATSGGTRFPDWYLNIPGYRVAKNIF